MSLRSIGLTVLVGLTLGVAGCSGGSTGDHPTVPSAPTSVQAVPGDGQVTVSWAGASGATSYNLYYATTSGAGTGGTKVTGVTSPYAVTGLSNGTTSYFVVTAVNAAGESDASAEVSATPSLSPPPAPTGVQATPADGQVTVSWAGASGATSYNLYYATTSGAGAGGTQVAGVSSPHAVTGLANGTTYYFVVTAVNAAGESAASAEVSAVPSANPPPAAPTGVQATAGIGSATISWSSVSSATSYNVYYAPASGAGTGGTQLAGVTSPYQVTGLTNGTTYYFVVTAVNGNGESTPSSEVSATPSGTPYIAAFALTIQGGGVPPFGFLEQARVCTDSSCSTPITDATVTVNGNTLTYDATQQQYTATATIAAGAAVTLHVTVGGTLYAASGTQFSAAPAVSAPTSGATWQATNANTISWSGGSPTAGAAYFVGVMDATGSFVYPAAGGDHGGPSELPIGTTTATVPAGTLPGGSDQVLVGIGSAGLVSQTSGGIAIPDAAAGSGLWLGLVAPVVPITVQGSNSPPAAPTGVQAVAGDGEVTLTWNASAGATTYDVYMSTTSGAGTSSGTHFPGVSSGFTAGGLNNGTTYYFVVTATNAHGESSPSAEVNATPAVGPPYIAATVLSMNPADAAMIGFLEQVDVCTDVSCNTPITNATVQVNGTTIPYDAGSGQYKSAAVSVAAGGSVTVSVRVGATTYTASGTQFTSRPTVSAPTANSIWQGANANTISWSGGGPTTGASYVVGVVSSAGDWLFPGTLRDGPGQYPIATTSVSVPAGTLPADGYAVLVGIGTTGIVDQTGGIAFSGARTGSALWLGYVSPLVNVLVQ